MTGTGKVAEKEFLDTYGMKVIQIPTNRKKQRIDYPDKIYATLPEKVFASLEYVKHYHEREIQSYFRWFGGNVRALFFFAFAWRNCS